MRVMDASLGLKTSSIRDNLNNLYLRMMHLSLIISVCCLGIYYCQSSIEGSFLNIIPAVFSFCLISHLVFIKNLKNLIGRYQIKLNLDILKNSPFSNGQSELKENKLFKLKQLYLGHSFFIFILLLVLGLHFFSLNCIVSGTPLEIPFIKNFYFLLVVGISFYLMLYDLHIVSEII